MDFIKEFAISKLIVFNVGHESLFEPTFNQCYEVDAIDSVLFNIRIAEALPIRNIRNLILVRCYTM